MQDQQLRLIIEAQNKANAELESLRKEVENVAKSTSDSFSKSSSSAASFAREIASIGWNVFQAGATAVTTTLTGLAGKGINAMSTMQSLQIQMNGLTKSVDLGNKAMAAAKDFWENNPFQRIDVAGATKMLLSYGRSVDDLNGDLKTLGNISITSGASLQELTAIYGKAAASGKLSQEIVNQFTERGIALLPELAKVTGKSVDSLVGNIGKANISFDQLKEALGNLVDPSIVEQLTNTLPRQMDRLGGAVTNLALSFVGGSMDIEKGFTAASDGIGQAVTNIVRELANLFKSNDILEAVGRAGKALAPVLNTVAGSIAKLEPYIVKFFDTIGNLGSMAGPAMAALAVGVGGFAAQLPVVGQFLGPITDSIGKFGKAIMSFAAANPFVAIAAGIAIFGTAVVNMGISAEQINNVVTSVFTGIGNMVTKVVGMLPSLVTAFADGFRMLAALIPNIIQNILDTIPLILNAFTEMIPLLVQSIVDAIPLIIGGMQQLMDGLIDAITTNLPTIIDAAIDLVTALVDGIIKALPMLIDAAVKLVSQLISGILKALPKIITAGVQLITALLQGIINMLPAIIDGTIQLIMSIVGAIIENLPLLINAAIQIVQALIKGLVDNIPMIITAIITLVTSLVNGIIQNLPMLITAAIQIIIALINGILQALPTLIAMIPEIITAIIKGLIDNLPQIIAMAPQIIISLVTGLLNALPQLIQAGVSLVKGLISGIGNMIGSLVSKAGEMASSIINSIKELPGKMLQAGKDMITGLVNGLNNAKDAVIQKIKDIAQGALDAIKNFFGIHSPSTVMMQIGDYMMEGLADGIEEAGKQAVKAADTVSADVADAFADPLQNASIALQNGQNTVSGNYTNPYSTSQPVASSTSYDNRKSVQQYVTQEIKNEMDAYTAARQMLFLANYGGTISEG